MPIVALGLMAIINSSQKKRESLQKLSQENEENFLKSPLANFLYLTFSFFLFFLLYNDFFTQKHTK